MTEQASANADFVYLRIQVPGRSNVREPLSRPEMVFAHPSGRTFVVPLTEAQLIEVVVDGAKALDRLRLMRGATAPDQGEHRG